MAAFDRWFPRGGAGSVNTVRLACRSRVSGRVLRLESSEAHVKSRPSYGRGLIGSLRGSIANRLPSASKKDILTAHATFQPGLACFIIKLLKRLEQGFLTF